MVYVNFDSKLSLLILECSCMLKMELQVPIITKALFFRKDHFTQVCGTLQVSEIKQERNPARFAVTHLFAHYSAC